MPRARPFCADESRENDEPLFATASRVDHWLLVEYRSLWSHDAFAGSGLSEQVKAHLREQVAATTANPAAVHPQSRAPRRAGSRRLRRHLARGRGTLRRVAFEDYRGPARRRSRRRRRRSRSTTRCCSCARTASTIPAAPATAGPLYDALADELEPDWVWQSTHVGGDRFAGNLVCLPHGLYYGRLDRPSQRAAVLDELLGEPRLPGLPTAGARATRSRFRRRSARFASRRGCSGSTTFGWSRRTAATTAPGPSPCRRGVAGSRRSTCARRHGELVHLTCSSETLRRPRRFVVTGRRARPSRVIRRNPSRTSRRPAPVDPPRRAVRGVRPR